jgi:xanthine/uracil permease
MRSFFSQGLVPAKMTTKVAAEEVPDSKAVTPVKQQIIWRNVVLLTVIHLLAVYAAVVIVPRVKLITFIWRRWRLVFLLRTYTSI